MDTQMWVITHKNYPGISDDLYRTLHVGRALSQDLGYTGDDTGDNISLKIEIIANLRDFTGFGKIINVIL